jgi:alpha-tubulin suppressor-like RCC1 family protein
MLRARITMPIGHRSRLLTLALLLPALGCREGAEPTALSDTPNDAPAVVALKFVQVSAGEDHSCGVTAIHEAYCWGSNDAGELGVGTTTGPERCSGLACSRRPVRVLGGLRFRRVSAAGRFHTCGVTTDDVAYCWGINALGQLGDGTENDSPRPVRVAGRLKFREVIAGLLHSCGVTTEHIAYCWGHNQAGELGNGGVNTELRPVRVARGLAFRHLSAGEQLTCGLTTDGAAYCWGENTVGQLGIGTADGPASCFTGDSSHPCSTKPVRVVRGLRFAQISVGNAHVCGVTTDHLAFCWGWNSGGQLGQRGRGESEFCLEPLTCSTRPIRVSGRLSFALVDAGATHTCGLTTVGQAYCWGTNLSGELGTGSPFDLEGCPIARHCSVRPLAVLGGFTFRSLQAGGGHTCAATVGGVAYCWGRKELGQVGDGTIDQRRRPRRVAAPG